MNKGGRPRKPVDLAQLEKLAAVGCQEGEMAWFFGIHPKVFSRNKTKEIQAAIDKGRENGRSALRRKQFEVALSGNPTMLIWLGKQELGQTDKRFIEQDVTHRKAAAEMTDDELLEVITGDTVSDIANKRRSEKRAARKDTGT